jgi:hypothetical protein
MWSEEAILLGTVSFMAVAATASGVAVYLYFRCRPRYPKRIRRTQQPGRGFDAGSVSPKLEQVRQDYVTALHHHPHPGFHARGLVGAVRRSIIRSGYFQERAKQELPADKISDN